MIKNYFMISLISEISPIIDSGGSQPGSGEDIIYLNF